MPMCLSVRVLHDEGFGVLFDRPGRREAARNDRGQHECEATSNVAQFSNYREPTLHSPSHPPNVAVIRRAELTAHLVFFEGDVDPVGGAPGGLRKSGQVGRFSFSPDSAPVP
jgi:hypothetical protein